jgi:hypothetical protein
MQELPAEELRRAEDLSDVLQELRRALRQRVRRLVLTKIRQEGRLA